MYHNFLSDLSFVPLHVLNCEDLFADKKVINKTDLLPRNIVYEVNLLNKMIRAEKIRSVEGYSTQYINFELVSIKLVKQPFVRTVYEAGFNTRHSTVTYLAATA